MKKVGQNRKWDKNEVHRKWVENQDSNFGQKSKGSGIDFFFFEKSEDFRTFA